MKSSLFSAFGAALFAFSSCIAFAVADASEDAGKKKEVLKPCTIRSPSSGHFFDLNPITVSLPEDKDKKTTQSNESWHAKGYDYGANFTLNFCAPVVEKLQDVEGVDRDLWRNVSAYYKDGKRTYSIG